MFENTFKGEINPFLNTASTDVSFPLNENWMTKIAANRQQISSLISLIMKNESLASHAAHPISENHVAHKTMEIERSHSINHLSNLVLSHPLEVGTSPILQFLKEKGYLLLQERLSENSGYPWDKIKTLKSPSLMEQLVDIHHLVQSSLDSQSEHTIMDFAIHLVELSNKTGLNDPHLKELIEETKQVLGQLIYLIDKNPQEALKIIQEKNYQDALIQIKETFSDAVNGICQRLHTIYMEHYSTQLQSPNIAINTRIPVEIADALLTRIGTINVGIIEILSDIFLSGESRPIDHEASLSYALKILQQSPKLRAEFNKVHAPATSSVLSRDVIRATLDLPAETTITDLHARKTALIALLSHLRQGGDGSCFAVSLAIEILSSHLSHCIKDLSQILQESKLSRTIKGIHKDIPFIKKINDENLHKIIKIDSEGCLVVNNKRLSSIWNAPGIQAAATAMNIPDCKVAMVNVIAGLGPDQIHDIKIKEVLKKLAEYASKQTNSKSQGELYAQAQFAFSSLTAQPLLKIWENAIAGMAEAEEGSMVKSAILQTTLDALQYRLGKLKIPPTPFLTIFFLTVQKKLFESIDLRYDPGAKEQDPDHRVSEGGFVLHNGKCRVDTPQAFILFINEILDEVAITLNKNDQSIQLKNIMGLLKDYVKTDQFIGYLLARYHPSNNNFVEALDQGHPGDYSTLAFTPWITQTGNNSKSVLSVYLETDIPIKSDNFVSRGAKEALTNIIEMCKRMPETEKKLFSSNPNKLKPFCILGKHRLPFTAGNPSLASAWQKNIPTQEWIEKYVLKPGREISNSQMDDATYENLMEVLQNEILPNFIPKEKMDSCMREIKGIPHNILIKNFRHAVMIICDKNNQLHRNKLTRLIDSALCNALNPKLRSKLEDSAVHFADTNWSNSIHDIHLCFVVNPSVGELELWEVCSNGTHLVALDQNYWLYNQHWEFFTIPEELVKDDIRNL